MANGRILVVGGGIAGLSAAWSLVTRGYEVELFEQGPLPNPSGSSYDEHRIIRHAYGTLAGYAAMMPAAFARWEALWAWLGTRHYDPCGTVYMFYDEVPDWAAASTASLDALGFAHEDLTPREIERRLPMVAQDGLVAGYRAEGSGMLFPARILLDLVVRLAASGVVLHANTRVDAVDPEHARLTVGGRSFAGDRLVVAAGAWVNRLLDLPPAEIRPSRQGAVYLAPPVDLAAAWAEAPVLVDMRPAGGCYTLPPRRNTRLKIADDLYTYRGDPDDGRAGTDLDMARLLDAAARAYARFGDYAILERKACYYSVTADARFISRPVGGAGWLLSACSGHGFKFGPLMGEGAAAAVTGERPAAAVTAWAAGEGDPTLISAPASRATT